MQQAQDFLEECLAVEALLQTVQSNEFEQKTQFKGWTITMILQHLFFFDRLALKSATDEAAFDAEWADFMRVCENDDDLVRATNIVLDGLNGQALFNAWRDGFRDVAEAFASIDPKARVKWVGPSMSARSSITARLMETWSHAQAIYDVLGQTRQNADRIKNIAILGVNTFGWTHKNRNEDIPDQMPHVVLAAPSGEIWEWGTPSETDMIQGPAEDFCMVVTQTRNIADTRLKITGPVASHWMAVAQCFAGPPRTPPAPGTRFCGA